MPLFLAYLFTRAGFGEGTTRAREEDVYWPKFLLDLTAHGLDVGELGDVRCNLHRLPVRTG